MMILPEPRRAVNPAPAVVPEVIPVILPAPGATALPAAVVALAGRQLLRRRFVRSLRIMPLAILVLVGGGGCAAVDVKTTATVGAEEADWAPGIPPKVTAAVALECTWHAAPPVVARAGCPR